MKINSAKLHDRPPSVKAEDSHLDFNPAANRGVEAGYMIII